MIEVDPSDELEEVNNLILNHLGHHGFNSTYRAFKEEMASSLAQRLLTAFCQGHSQQFFRLFQGARQPKDAMLQFQLRVYFLIFAIHPALGNCSRIPQQQKDSFSAFIAMHGAQYADFRHLLPLFSLPFIQQPRKESGLRPIFSRKWVEELKGKLNRHLYSRSPLELELREGKCARQGLSQSASWWAAGLQSQVRECEAKWFSIAKGMSKCLETVLMKCRRERVRLSQELEQQVDGYVWYSHHGFVEAINLSISLFKNRTEVVAPTLIDTTFQGIAADRVAFLLGDRQDERVNRLLLAVQNNFKELAKHPPSKRHFVILLCEYDVLRFKDLSTVRRLLQSDSVKPNYYRTLRYLAQDHFGLKWLCGCEKLVQELVLRAREITGGDAAQVFPIVERLSTHPPVQDLLLAAGIVPQIVAALTEKTNLESGLEDSLVSTLLALTERKEARKSLQSEEVLAALLQKSASCEAEQRKMLLEAIIWVLVEEPKMRRSAFGLGLLGHSKAQIQKAQHPQRIIQSIHIIRRMLNKQQQEDFNDINRLEADDLLLEGPDDLSQPDEYVSYTELLPSQSEKRAQFERTKPIFSAQMACLQGLQFSDFGKSEKAWPRKESRLQQLNNKRRKNKRV